MKGKSTRPEVLVGLLARIVAAREELGLGDVNEATAILRDLEADLAGLIERAA